MTNETIARRALLKGAVALSIADTAAPATAAATTAAASPTVIDPRDFGARCDGESDDSPAIQRAIDACMRQTPAAILSITGFCAIRSPLIIDRKVDASDGRFRIVGMGGSAGLRAYGSMIMFVTRLRNGIHPATEFLSLERLRLFAPRDSEAVAIGSGFLRVQIVDCDFDGLRASESSTYLQEWILERNVARFWRGSFIEASGAFAFRSSDNKFQHGDGVYEIADRSGQFGCVGCSFERDLVESCSGLYLRVEQAQAVNVRGLYFEGNAGTAIVLNERFPGVCVTVDSCFFMPQEQNRLNPDLHAIRWGKTERGLSSGNWSGGLLHDAPSGADVSFQGDFTDNGKPAY